MRLGNQRRPAVPAVDHDNFAAVARKIDCAGQPGRPSTYNQGIDVFHFKNRACGFVSSNQTIETHRPLQTVTSEVEKVWKVTRARARPISYLPTGLGMSGFPGAGLTVILLSGILSRP